MKIFVPRRNKMNNATDSAYHLITATDNYFCVASDVIFISLRGFDGCSQHKRNDQPLYDEFQGKNKISSIPKISTAFPKRPEGFVLLIN